MDSDQEEEDKRQVEEMCTRRDLDDSDAEPGSFRSSFSSSQTVVGDLTSNSVASHGIDSLDAARKKQARKLGFKNVRFLDKAEVPDQPR